MTEKDKHWNDSGKLSKFEQSRKSGGFREFFVYKKFSMCSGRFSKPDAFLPTYIINDRCNSKQFKFPDQISDLKILNAIYHIKEKEKSIPFMFYIL